MQVILDNELLLTDDLIKDIKQEQGFVSSFYLDPRGYPSVGHGTKLPLSKEESEILLKVRLDNMVKELLEIKPWIADLETNAQQVVYRLLYTLGLNKLVTYKDFFRALKNRKYIQAKEALVDTDLYDKYSEQLQPLIDKMSNVYIPMEDN